MHSEDTDPGTNTTLKGTMKTLRLLAFCGAALLLTLLQSPAQGLLLSPFDPDTGPPTPTDLNAVNVPIIYSGGIFSAGGAAPPILLGYTDPTGQSWGQEGTGSFTLTANIDSSGNLSSGLLSVSALFVANDPTLTATLMTGPQGSPAGSAPLGSAWDYVNGYNDDLSFAGITAFAFSYTITGGTLAGDFGGIGAAGLIELVSSDDVDPFDLTASYNNGGATVDVFPIPEPTSFLLFVISGAVWSVARRSRHGFFRSAV